MEQTASWEAKSC